VVRVFHLRYGGGTGVWERAMKSAVTRIIALTFLCCVASGCVATWGSSYHVDAEDSSGVVIRYDSILVGVEAIDKHATEICARYHKTAVPKSRRDAAIIPGGSLMEATYSCVP
jgi:hypothetical protein